MEGRQAVPQTRSWYIFTEMGSRCEIASRLDRYSP